MDENKGGYTREEFLAETGIDPVLVLQEAGLPVPSEVEGDE